MGKLKSLVGRLVGGSSAEPQLLPVGTQAPDFEVAAHDGSTVKLSDFRGRKVILWFYPKADTPGWTIQGNGFRDQQAEFDAKNVQILGLSFDSVDDNRAFAEKFGYDFPLLCDTDRKVGMAYGACGSADTGYAPRVSFVIDENGVIAHALAKVDPASHTATMLGYVS